MAGKVFFSVSMSLDGYIAPESVPVEDLFATEKQDDPDVQRWMAQWMFEGVDAGRVALEPVRADPTQRVTHLTYAVGER